MNPGRLIRNAELAEGRRDVRIAEGRIAEIGIGLTGEEMVDARGGALIPGLADHHIHLLATAARLDSVVLDDLTSPEDLISALKRADAEAPAGMWLRATGYHERIAGDLDRHALDLAVAHRPTRVQHQSGKLWILNSVGLDAVLHGESPACVERDSRGVATGRVWRGDAWLGSRIERPPPDVSRVARDLLACGVTELTDATVTTDRRSAALLAEARRKGRIPQRLRLMSGDAISAPEDDAFEVGELKILLDEDDLPDFKETCGSVVAAGRVGRKPAFHCVTAAELAFALAVLDASGRPSGARIEHGSVIPEETIARLRELKVTVVTQPALIADRGDRYLADMPEEERSDLYRVRSLIAGGVEVASSSDAPYGALDPWRGLAAAVTRRTKSGSIVAQDEAVSPLAALSLCLGRLDAPAVLRSVEVGADANLCLLRAPLREALASPSCGIVAATFIEGDLKHLA